MVSARLPRTAPLQFVHGWPAPARFAMLLVGLALYGFCLRLTVNAALGVSPWDVLHTGLALQTSLTTGQVMIGVGALVVAVSWAWLKEPVGLGTLLNVVLVGMFFDLFAFFPLSEVLWLRVAELLAGTWLLGLATGMYVSAGLGAGPRDGLVLGLHRKFGWSVARVRTGVELLALACGVLLGGLLGGGTLVFALLIGPAMSWGLGLFGTKKTPQSRPQPTC